MASRKQKQDLIQALKFTPREIEISLSGYGGEIVMGRISEEAYDFWEGRDDLGDYATSWEGDFDEDVPPEARFVDDGCWHDVDDLCHESGCEASDGSWLTVEDSLESRTLLECSTDLDALDARGIDTSNHSHVRPEETEESGTCVFLAQNFEKGCFFSGRVQINRPFDPALLSISWTDCDGWKIIGGVMYDGEDVDGQGAYSTTGKGMEFKVYRVERADDWDAVAELDKILEDIPLIEGEEIWAQEAIDSEPETWNGIALTKWWPGDFQPVHRGEYEVFAQDARWPFPQRARWTGRKWVSDKKEIEVSKWRGLSQPA